MVFNQCRNHYYCVFKDLLIHEEVSDIKIWVHFRGIDMLLNNTTALAGTHDDGDRIAYGNICIMKYQQRPCYIIYTCLLRSIDMLCLCYLFIIRCSI